MNLRRLSAVSFGHMAIDILNASIAMILAVLAVPFNITNAQIGLGGMAYALMGSLTQPFFGVLADRFGGRWLGAVGLLWTAVFYYAATFSQNYFTLITLMTVASLGSGAFHPQGAMNAGAAGGHRATTGTSVFFLLGQMGLADAEGRRGRDCGRPAGRDLDARPPHHGNRDASVRGVDGHWPAQAAGASRGGTAAARYFRAAAAPATTSRARSLWVRPRCTI